VGNSNSGVPSSGWLLEGCFEGAGAPESFTANEKPMRSNILYISEMNN
jgi:hypothetical protein